MDNDTTLSPAMKIFTWRGDGAKTIPAPADFPAPAFVPAVPNAAPVVEIKLAGAVVQIWPGADATLLAGVLQALRHPEATPAGPAGLPHNFFGPR